jgi:hypothetical protein
VDAGKQADRTSRKSRFVRDGRPAVAEPGLRLGNVHQERGGTLALGFASRESISSLSKHGVRSLPISVRHALAAGNLPFHHHDPFDRMLVAQAQCEGLTLVTVDPQVMAYDIAVLDASR